VLTGWDETDAAIEANWQGEPGEFVLALQLQDAGFLDRAENGTLVLHDWREHNGWACGAKARSEAAKSAAVSRWAKHTKCKTGANACEAHTNGNADSCEAHCGTYDERNAPSPSPSPKPSPIQDFLPGSMEYGLASFLFDAIRLNNPKAKAPDLQTWARVFDRLTLGMKGNGSGQRAESGRTPYAFPISRAARW